MRFSDMKRAVAAKKSKEFSIGRKCSMAVYDHGNTCNLKVRGKIIAQILFPDTDNVRLYLPITGRTGALFETLRVGVPRQSRSVYDER